MAKSMMQAVGVVPGHRAVRLMEHEAPKVSAANHVKIRSLEVGVCGTDREICTFVYGSPPTGFENLVLGHESLDRKSTRLNSSHRCISYAVFCLKKKKHNS